MDYNFSCLGRSNHYNVIYGFNLVNRTAKIKLTLIYSFSNFIPKS
jgi:hypothetical protein